jgi:hypothetical protein
MPNQPKSYLRTLTLKRKNFEKDEIFVKTAKSLFLLRCLVTDSESRQDNDDHPIDVKQAVAAYAQSEKVKSGLIWICQVAEQVAVMEDPGRQQAVMLLSTLAHLVADEANLAGRITADRRWHEVGQKINMALVMINSGVPQETSFHLTRALTRVTRIGGQAASVLKNNGLF